MLFELFNFFFMVLSFFRDCPLSIRLRCVIFVGSFFLFSFDAYVNVLFFGLFFLQLWKWTWTNIAMLRIEKSIKQNEEEKRQSWIVRCTYENHNDYMHNLSLSPDLSPSLLTLSISASHLFVLRFMDSIRTGNNISLLMVCYFSSSYCFGLGSCSA